MEPEFKPEVELKEVGNVFSHREGDSKRVIQLKDQYEHESDYCYRFRLAVLKEWHNERSNMSYIKSSSNNMYFKKFLNEKKKKDVWTTSFAYPANSRGRNSKGSCRINVSDSVYLTWDTSENMKRGLKPDFEIMIGKVKRIHQRTIYASFNLGLNEHPPDYNQNGQPQARIRYHIGFGPSTTIPKRKLEALALFDTLNPIIQKYILGSLEPNDSCAFCEEINDLPSTLNPSQKEAVAKALTNPFTLIQGPPGCGKTHVISEIVYQLLTRNPHERILACGPSNVTIENQVFAIKRRIGGDPSRLVWTGSSKMDFKSLNGLSETQKSLAYYHMLHRDTIEAERFAELQYESWDHPLDPKKEEECERLRSIIEQNVVAEAQVVCCTLISAGKQCLNTLLFDTVIIDEATQSFEPECIIPFIHCASRVILVGDQRQLGPSLNNSQDLKRIGYERSMFERLVNLYGNNKNCFSLLNLQYRMHPLISEFPSLTFYGGSIANGVSASDRCGFIQPVTFFDVKGIEKKEGTSYYNEEETKVIYDIVNIMRRVGVQYSQIGIITPYAEQKTKLRNMIFSYTNNRDLKIASVDNFQGNERDYIIVSLTKTDPSSLSSFFVDERRINVTLTRARYGLIIVGNYDSMSESTCKWRDLSEFCSERGYVFSDINILKQEIMRRNQIKEGFNLGISITNEDSKPTPIDGINIKEVFMPITGSKYEIIWGTSDFSSLRLQIHNYIALLESGKEVTIAFDTESVCIQFGFVFNSDFDIMDFNNEDIPEIGDCPGFIIMYIDEKGEIIDFSELSSILSPLFGHPRVTILSFDFTRDLKVLSDLRIEFNTSRLFDAQVSSIGNKIDSIIRNTAVKGLESLISQSMCDDPYMNRAKDWLADKHKEYPWDANRYLIHHKDLSIVSYVTEEFLQYASADIALTALSCKDFLMKGSAERVALLSKMKLDEFNDFGPYIAHNIRQIEFGRSKISPIMEGKLDHTLQTQTLLGYWSHIYELIEFAKNHQQILFNELRFTDNMFKTLKQKEEKCREILVMKRHFDAIQYTSRLIEKKK